MLIIDKIFSNQQSKLKYVLTKLLLLIQVNSIKEHDLNNILKLIGEKLKILNISFVFSGFDKEKKNIIIKYLSSSYGNEDLPTIDPTPVDRLRSYDEVINTKRPVFNLGRGEQLAKMIPATKDYLEKLPNFKNINSIVAPLLIRDEIIAFIELISDNIKEEDLELIKDFSKDLAINLAQIILFSEIKRSEFRYRDLFENSQEGFFILNGRRKCFVEVNKGWCDITGYTKEELLQMNHLTIVDPKERNRIESYNRMRLDNNSFEKAPDNYETIIITKKGEKKYIKIKIARILSPDEWFVVVYDRTEKIKAEKILKENEELYRKLVENANSIILKRQVDGTIIFINKFAEKFFGFSRKELLGKNVIGTIVPEYDSNGNDLKTLIKNISLNPGDYALNQNENITKDGRKVWISWSNKGIYDSNGQLTGILAIGNDVTEKIKTKEKLKTSEEKYKYVFNNNPLPSIIFDKDTLKIVDVNQAAIDKYGYSYEEFTGSITIKDIRDKDQLPELNKALVMTPEELSKIPYFKHKKKDGTLFDVMTSVHDLTLNNKNCRIVVITDITERRAAENALRESEEKFKTLAENNLDVIMRFDLDLRHLYVNAIAEDQTGIPAENFIGKTHAELGFPPELVEIWEKALKKTIKTQQTNNIEFMLPNNIWIDWLLIPEFSPEGKIKGVITSARDITERKKIENELKSSEQKYRQLVDNAKESVFIMNGKGFITFFNKAFFKLTGYSQEEIDNLHYSVWVHPDDLKNFSESFAKRFKGETDDKQSTEICKIIDKKGEIKFFKYNAVDIKQEDEVTGIQMIGRDVTSDIINQEKIRQLSEFNQKILDNIPVSIITINKDGYITSTNKYFKNFSGEIDHTKKSIFKSEFFEREGLKDKYKLLLKNGNSFKIDNRYEKNVNEDEKYLNIIAVPLRDKNNEIEGVLSMAVDNTDAKIYKDKLEELNKKLERKVEERTKQLDQANRNLADALNLKMKFIADASHELRTPITIMQGNLDLLEKEKEKCAPDVRETFDLIKKEVDQMRGILSDLTVLANADSHADKTVFEKIDLCTLVDTVARSMKVLADEKNIKIKVLDCPNIKIVGDENKLERLFLNIIRNAIKYNKNNGIIKIWSEKENDNIKIFIEDSGIGIPEKDIPFIFERFYRVDKSRSRSEGGSGLGLAICKLIAEAHGGKIEVKSKLEIGTTFTTTLPIKPNLNKLKNFDIKLSNL